MPPSLPCPAPPAQIPAQVCLEEFNTLEPSDIIVSHLWQEYHWKAPKGVYVGKTDDDTRVAENLSDDLILRPKTNLNTAFCETAIATLEIDIPAGQKLYLRWWLEDANGIVVEEHPDFTKAHFDSKGGVALLKTAKYAWRWDGRRTNSSGHRVFLRDQPCWSRIAVKSASDKTIAVGSRERAILLVKGEPYKVWIAGVPKNDEEFEATKTAHGTGSWLGKDGARLATDSWIKIYRGVEAIPADDGFVVFLGHGALEATQYLTDLAGGVTKNGAIATPHDQEYRGWIRRRHFNSGAEVSLCEIADVSPAPGKEALIKLARFHDSSGDLPPANNPFCQTYPNQPFKDGVQRHQSSVSVVETGPTFFLIDNASTGCTTIADRSTGDSAHPAAVLGSLRSVRSWFGKWNGPHPTTVANQNKLWGPPLESGRPGTFYNKQNKRNSVSDALIEDSFDFPLVEVPPGDTGPFYHDEPLHMQPTFQHGLFGGFLEQEIAYSSTVKDEPDAPAHVNPKLRLRCKLFNAPENSKAWQYHRLVVFGHIVTRSWGKVCVEVWVPRLVQRLWNGHWRNVLVGEKSSNSFTLNHCEYAWFFEQRNLDGTTLNRGWIGKKPEIGHEYVALDDIGHLSKKDLKLPSEELGGLMAGARLFSVFKYKIKLLPIANTNSSVWNTLPSREDLFSHLISRARLTDEKISQTDADCHLEGQSELELPFHSCPGDFTAPVGTVIG